MASRVEKPRCGAEGCQQFVVSHHLSCREHLFLTNSAHFLPPQGSNPCGSCKAMARSTYVETRQAFSHREATGAFTSRATLRAGAKTPQAAGSKQVAFAGKLKATMEAAAARAKSVDPLTHSGALGITDRHKGSVRTPRGDIRMGRSPRPIPQNVAAPDSGPAGLEQQGSPVQTTATKQSHPAGSDVSVQQSPREGLPPPVSGPPGSEQEQDRADTSVTTPSDGGAKYVVSPSITAGVDLGHGEVAPQTDNSQILSSSPVESNLGMLPLQSNIDQRYAGDDEVSLEASDREFSDGNETGESSGESVSNQEQGESEQRSALTGRTAANSSETWEAPTNRVASVG